MRETLKCPGCGAEMKFVRMYEEMQKELRNGEADKR